MTCSIDGCPNKIRARGLCSTHYNQVLQPQRHHYVEVACDNCGCLCLKQVTAKYGARFCCLSCRDEWRRAGFAYTPGEVASVLRASQRWRGAVHTIALLAQARYIRRRGIADLLAPRACEDCGFVFTPLTTVQRYCRGGCARRVHKRARRAAEQGALGTFTWAEVIHLYLLFDKRCAYCTSHMDRLEPDHVVPLSKGGSNSITNILPCCRACNSDKRDLLLHEWNADRERRALPPVTTTWAANDPRVQHLTSLRRTAKRTLDAA